MKNSDIRVLRTYDQLLSGIMELLITKKFDDISVSEICTAANVHRATFYNHFKDKYEFLDFCFENKLNEITFDELQAGSSPEIIKTNIMHFVLRVLEFIDENRLFLTSAFDGKDSFAFKTSFSSAISNFCFEKLSSVLSAPSRRIAIVAEFYSGAFIGIIKWHITCGTKDDVEHIMTFLEHRVDELLGFYEKNLIDAD